MSSSTAVGADSLFYKTYEGVWGVERWPYLYDAMKAPTRHVARVNGFLTGKDTVRVRLSALPGARCLATPSSSSSSQGQDEADKKVEEDR